MMKSMTAFARVENNGADPTVRIEIRTYNSRYLDLSLRIPQRYQALEEKIKARIQETVARGRVEMSLQVQNLLEETAEFEIDDAKARAYVSVVSALKERYGISTDLSLDHLSQVPGIIKPKEIDVDAEGCWESIRESLSECLEILDRMRGKEGAFLQRDLESRLTGIEAVIDDIEKDADGMVAVYQTRLKERINALTQGMVEIDPARIAQEAAFLADRSDISEEIVRARSHLKQFRTIMAADEPAGRKLNFLLQEFNREFNTIGAKTGSTDISHRVVQLKSELEKIREQVQNIE